MMRIGGTAGVAARLAGGVLWLAQALAARDALAGDVVLSWTAPGDNGTEGRASAYELRYSTAPPGADTTAWWSAATAIPSPPAPRSAGLAESLAVSGLAAEVPHFFALRAVDEAGNRSGISNVTSASPAPDTTGPPPDTSGAPPDSIPPAISAVADSALSPTEAAISWRTDEPADARVAYGIGGDLSLLSPLDPTRALDHTVLLSGLLPDTTYSYRVTSRDSVGNAAEAGPFSFRTPATPDTTPPAVSGLSVTSITETGATVSWRTDEPSSAWVEHGTTTAYGGVAPSETGISTEHVARLAGLPSGTRIHFRVVAEDSGGRRGATEDYVFDTPVAPSPPGDTLAPDVAEVSAQVESPNRVRISWSTGEPTTGEVIYAPAGGWAASSTADTLLATEHTLLVAGLAESTPFTFQVVARDTAGNLAVAGPFSFETPSSEDLAPPSITDLAAEATSPTAVVVRWVTDEPADSQVEFGLTAGLGLATPLDDSLRAEHAIAIGGLLPGETYRYQALSRDGAGNLARSEVGLVTLPEAPAPAADTTAPAIRGLAAEVLGPSRVRIRWATDEPADAQVAYGPGSEPKSLSALDPRLLRDHEMLLDGLQDGTAWTFAAISVDSAGNRAESPQGRFETPSADDATPPEISTVVIIGVTATTAEVRWGTNEPADGQVEYGETEAYGHATPLEEALTISHAVGLSGLRPETLYHVRVVSRDGAGNLARSGDATFLTAPLGGAPADTTPPFATDVTASPAGPTEVRVTWSTSEPARGQVEYGLTEAYGLLSQGEGGFALSHEALLEGLASGTLFHYRVVSRDEAGNVGVSEDRIFETESDRTPPPPPSAASAAPGPEGLVVTWSASDAPDLAGYRVYRSSGGPYEPLTPVPIAETSLVDGDAPVDAAEIVYAVSAVDLSGNESPWALVTLSVGCSLDPSRPNPANPAALFRFRTPLRPGGASTKVGLAVYDVAGALVRTLVDDDLPSGEHEAYWDGRDWRGQPVASGPYLARLVAGSQSAVRKVIVLR